MPFGLGGEKRAQGGWPSGSWRRSNNPFSARRRRRGNNSNKNSGGQSRCGLVETAAAPPSTPSLGTPGRNSGREPKDRGSNKRLAPWKLYRPEMMKREDDVGMVTNDCIRICRRADDSTGDESKSAGAATMSGERDLRPLWRPEQSLRRYRRRLLRSPPADDDGRLA
jgi:hypothetical protein